MKKALFVFLLILSVLLCSCKGKDLSADSVLNRMLAFSGEGMEESGVLFSSSAEENTLGYMSDENKRIMYSEKAGSDCFPKIEQFAIFVSAHGVCELAVFKCYSASDTDAIIEMCAERAGTIKVALRGSIWEEKSKNARIAVSSRWVAFVLCDDSEKAEECFNKIV